MRILNIVLLLILILFAAVQYNDPDGLFWALVYGVGGVWCAVAAFRAGLFAKGAAFGLYVLSFAASIFGLAWFWPKTHHFWMMDVWWETETAREGMGMMILVAAMLAAGWGALRARRV